MDRSENGPPTIAKLPVTPWHPIRTEGTAELPARQKKMPAHDRSQSLQKLILTRKQRRDCPFAVVLD